MQVWCVQQWCVQVWCLLPLDLGGGLSRGGTGGGGRFPSTSSDDSSPLNGEAVCMCVCVCGWGSTIRVLYNFRTVADYFAWP